MKPIIQARGIWKGYKIGAKQERYLSLRDSVSSLGKSLFRKEEETFWALKDVNFDVGQGECLGIIGRNGAGKSTLLKILSRITPPSKGKIIMRGRVASLLEVGTGFHSELTGRENIFLNGSILGMKNNEIKQSFDEIVDFSGVEHFLDTPLKHYSSGMQLRLAFSVAAHLNPEILLIDEVLAVGDSAFQKRCLGKMDEVSKSGRTVIFVSHDLGAVSKLCPKTCYMKNGSLINVGKTSEIISRYLNETHLSSTAHIKRDGSGEINVDSIMYENDIDSQKSNLYSMCPLRITMNCTAVSRLKQVSFAVCFNNMQNNRITSIWSAFVGKSYTIEKGKFSIDFHLPELHLIPGKYEVLIYINQGEKVIEEIKNYHVVDVIYHSASMDNRVPKIGQGVYVESFTTAMNPTQKNIQSEDISQKG